MRATLLTLAALAGLPLHAGIKIQQKDANVAVFIDDKLFTEYRADTRVPCLYPLMSPSGTHLTRQYPFVEGVEGEASDHPHHTGFWFTHGAVNGKDFWHKPDCRIVTKSVIGSPTVTETVSGGNEASATFTVDLAWEADGKKQLAEHRTYTITARGKTRVIDVQSILGATEGDVLFGDTKEGSCAIRVAPSLRLKGDVAKGGITNSEGVTNDDAWGKRAKWVAYHGPDDKGTPTVIALLDHAKNLRHPTWWHARNYGLLAANPFGQHDFERKGDQPKLGDYTLKKGESLIQRYRLILLEGDFDAGAIEKSWQEFSE